MKFKDTGMYMSAKAKDDDGDAVVMDVFKGDLEGLRYRLLLRVDGAPSAVGLTHKKAVKLAKAILAEAGE